MKRSLLWCALILTAAITLVWPMIPVASGKNRLASIPASHPDFQSRKLEMAPNDVAFLGAAEATQHLIMMQGGGRLVLTMIDGTKNRHAVHDPRYCFSGAGWTIQAKNDTIKLSSGTATWVSLAKDDQKTEALWFFDDGTKQFTTPFQYWLATSCRRVTLGHSGAEPVLVTLRSLPGESVNWDRVRLILLPALGFR